MLLGSFPLQETDKWPPHSMIEVACCAFLASKSNMRCFVSLSLVLKVDTGKANVEDDLPCICDCLMETQIANVSPQEKLLFCQGSGGDKGKKNIQSWGQTRLF